MTQHLHRLFLCVPDALRTQADAWIKQNLDPNGADWLSVPLSATGEPPATYWACDAALTPAQVKALAVRLLQFSGVSLPSNWDQRTLRQKRAWLCDTFPVRLWQDREDEDKRIGVMYVQNDGDWSDHQIEARLAQVGLQWVVTDPSGEGEE